MSDHPLLAEITVFIEKHDMTESTFGRLAVKDWKFVKQVRDGRRLWPETVERVRMFMAGYQPAERKAA